MKENVPDIRAGLNKCDSFLIIKKNELLTAVYTRNGSAVRQVLSRILIHAMQVDEFNENDEKTVNQILVIAKTFRPVFSGPLLPGQSSADQSNAGRRPPEADISCTELKAKIQQQIKTQRHAVAHISYSQWKQKLNISAKAMDLVFKTAMSFQLTTGCSHFCRRCNEWALPGVRSHFSFNAVCAILDHMAARDNPEISLYSASDPLDWEHKDKTLLDIIEHIQSLPIEYSLLSKVPKGKKELLNSLIKSNANLSVSVTSKNKTRIKQWEPDLEGPIYKQHDTNDLLIAAGLDEDFTTVKPSITDGYGTEITPDGAFIIIPTFTSALHPFGHKKIPVTNDISFFPEKKTGRHALLVDYFKPLKGYDLKQNILYMEKLLDVQVESIILDSGKEELTPAGMRSFQEYLSIFNEPARIRRKRMSLTAIRHLKAEHLSGTSFKNLMNWKKTVYQKKITHHLNFCKKEYCSELKLYTISFFLNAVRDYRINHPERLTILEYLIKDEIDKNRQMKTIFNQYPVKATILNPDMDDFQIFRYCMIMILTGNESKNISDFIHASKAAYDPVIDAFTSAKKRNGLPDHF